MNTWKRVLVISAHPDDAEIGCGATISRLCSEGASVINIVLSVSENTGTEYEAIEAAERLGMSIVFFGFPHRRLDTVRSEVLDKFVEERNLYDPDVVFMPCLDDLHQDHSVCAIEGVRAFRNSSIFGYEMLWNNLAFSPRFFVSVDPKHLDMKGLALKCYKSQKDRAYMDPMFSKSMAVARGIQSGLKYAEAFEVIRCVWR